MLAFSFISKFDTGNRIGIMPSVTEFATVVTSAPHVNVVGSNAAGASIVIRYRPAKFTVPVALSSPLLIVMLSVSTLPSASLPVTANTAFAAVFADVVSVIGPYPPSSKKKRIVCPAVKPSPTSSVPAVDVVVDAGKCCPCCRLFADRKARAVRTAAVLHACWDCNYRCHCKTPLVVV